MSPFIFSDELLPLTPLRKAINAAYHQDEAACLEVLLKAAELPEMLLEKIRHAAERLVISVREQRLGKGGLDAFLYQYDLSTEEGIALMCLAEATLRVPDRRYHRSIN